MAVQDPMDDFDRGRPDLEVAPGHHFKISLLDLWQIARIRHRLILIAAGSIVLLVGIVLFSLTPRFTGSTLLTLNNQQGSVINLPAIMNGLPADQPTILTQIQILQSDQTVEQVVKKLGLDRDPEFNRALKKSWLGFIGYLNPRRLFLNPSDDSKNIAAQIHQRVIDAVGNSLNVQQMQLSTAIQVNFQSIDPIKAARIADAVADAYIEAQLDAKFDASRRANQWLSSRLGGLSAQANAAQTAVESYKAQHRLTDTASANGVGQVSILDQQIAQINSQLMQAQQARAQAEATAGQVKMLVQGGHAEQVNQVLTSPLITQYRQQQAVLVQQIAQMSSRYGPEHPKMLDLQASKRDLDAKINEEVKNVVGTTDNDVAVARAHEAVVQSQLARLEGQSGVQGQDRVKLVQLAATAASTRALYDTFVQRAKETEQQQGLLIPDARVLSRATPPSQASFPKTFMILALAFPLSLMLGYMLAFVVERMDQGFRVVARAEEMLGLPVFATLPDVGNKSGDPPDAATWVIDKPLSAYSESIRGLQMGITLSNVDHLPKVIVVTSAIPSEGKTTTAVSLARHVSQTGQKVVIVDGDLRRPTVSNFSTDERGKFDLIDVLTGTCSLDQALIKDSKSPAVILPTYQRVKNAPDLIESQAMAKVIAQLRTAFDYVIIDSAPVLPVNDTKILARLADSVLFAIRWDETPRNTAYDAIKALREVHAPIAGLVLTRADIDRFHYYSFGYGGYNYAYKKYYEV